MEKLTKTGILFFPKTHFRRKSAVMLKLISAFLVFILCVVQAGAQGHQVTGTIVDDNGVSLPGVNVFIEGTTIGTITDLDGNYTINAPSSTSVLVFSFVGYSRFRIPIEGRAVIDVTLNLEIRTIDEIVVVGYGTTLREKLTGSVSTLSGEKMDISTAPNMIGRIQGQISGVTVTTANRPGGDVTVRVRGMGTINDNNPLYVIDGVPAEPGNNLNPNDIESISVLKDASSAAIYGTRGANGVVIITTKRGRQNQKPTVTFNTRAGITQAVNQYDLINTEEYGEMLWIEARNKGLTPGVDYSHPQYGSGTTPRIPDYILPAGAMSGDPATSPVLYSFPDYVIFPANKEGTNWYDEIYRNGQFREYDLSVRGGGENVTYSFSGSYLNEEGYLIHTSFERFTFRNNTDAQFNKWFKAGQSVQVAYINEFGNLSDNSEATIISQAYRAQPIIPVYDIMGNYAGSKAPGMGNSQNPVALLDRAQNNNGKYYRVLGNVFAEANIIEGLTFKSLFGYNLGQWNGKYLTIANFEMSEPNRIDGLSVSSNYSLQWNWSNTLNYVTTLADVHRLNVIVGTEAIENTYQWLNAGRSQYFSTDPNYMQLSSGEINQSNSGSGSEWALFSIFGRVNYDFQGKYLVEGTARRDGSSRFGAENRYATFPAASVAWAISQEDFMAGTRSWLDFLKLRLGWGKSGNDRIGDYNIFSTYGTNIHHAAYDIGGTNTSSVVGFQPSARGNPNVTWEATETIDVGLDVILLNNTLNFNFDIWRRNTSDMLYRLSVPQVVGVATPPFVNIGEMKNTGFDIEMGYRNSALAGKLRYGATATISRYRNEIMKLSDDVEEEIIGATERQMNYTRATVGTAFPEFYGYTVDGIFQTDEEANAHPVAFASDYNKPGHFKFRDISGPDGVPDGIISDADRTYIGSPHPDFTGGLNLDLGYGNFDLNLFFYGSYGNEMINYVRRWIDFGQFNGGKSREALLKSWGSPYLDNNADATLPMHDLSDISQYPSTHFVEDASYLRLKSLRLGYTLPQQLVNRVQVQSLRLYVQATNLFTLTKYSGLDPEVNASGTYMGMDLGAWPTPRQILFGVSIGL